MSAMTVLSISQRFLLATKARRKLVTAANKHSGKDYDLRVLVGHANLLDKLSESVSDFGMFGRESEKSDKVDIYEDDSDSYSESEEEDDDEYDDEDDDYQSFSSASSSDLDPGTDLLTTEAYFSCTKGKVEQVYSDDDDEEEEEEEEEEKSNYILESQPGLYKCSSRDVRVSSTLLHVPPLVTEEAVFSDEESKEEDEEEDLGTLVPVHVL